MGYHNNVIIHILSHHFLVFEYFFMFISGFYSLSQYFLFLTQVSVAILIFEIFVKWITEGITSLKFPMLH